MLTEISRSITCSRLGLQRPPFRASSLLLELRAQGQFLGSGTSVSRSLSTKREQQDTFEAHLQARKEYVKALDTQFVPDMPNEKVRALSCRIAGLLDPAVRKGPASPCPNIATLRLDQALEDGQWLLVRPTGAKRDWVEVALQTLLPEGSVIQSSLCIPRSVLEGADAVWLCPYFDPETVTLRFQKASGDDSTVMFSLEQLLMSECGRSLAELAYGEGLIPSTTYTSALSEIQQVQTVNVAAPKVQERSKTKGSPAEHPESEPRRRHRRHRPNTCEAIRTLQRSEVVAQQQVLCFDKQLARTTRQVNVGKWKLGTAEFKFPKRLLPKDGSAFYCCPYFDPKLGELRYCTPDDEDIPGISVSMMEMARSKVLRPLLSLAKAEGMIFRIPGDGYIKTLRLDEALASGYVVELQLPTETVGYITLSVYLGPHSGIALLRCTAMPDPHRNRVQLVPYVHASGNLRLWDKERSQDWEFEPGKVFERSPDFVKEASPTLFKMGESEGLWKSGSSGWKWGKMLNYLVVLRDIWELVQGYIFHNGDNDNSKEK
ncbi:hypothetical protein FRC01_011344 [Tulasnella sp. 417]|nr:hypothetical protein FRC01_011344 [Tulasnella sp. 417]